MANICRIYMDLRHRFTYAVCLFDLLARAVSVGGLSQRTQQNNNISVYTRVCIHAIGSLRHYKYNQVNKQQTLSVWQMMIIAPIVRACWLCDNKRAIRIYSDTCFKLRMHSETDYSNGQIGSHKIRTQTQQQHRIIAPSTLNPCPDQQPR